MKKVITMLMIFCMLFSTSTVAFAAEASETVESVSVNASTLHKINGTYSDNGAGDSYTTKISRTCYEIRVKGTTYDSVTPKLVNVVVYNSQELVVASITNVRLDNKEYTMYMYKK